MSDKQRLKMLTNVSQAVQGITPECVQIVAMIKADYPYLVTIPGSSDVKVWKSLPDVREYFGWKDKKLVAKLYSRQTRLVL